MPSFWRFPSPGALRATLRREQPTAPAEGSSPRVTPRRNFWLGLVGGAVDLVRANPALAWVALAGLLLAAWNRHAPFLF